MVERVQGVQGEQKKLGTQSCALLVKETWGAKNLPGVLGGLWVQTRFDGDQAKARVKKSNWGGTGEVLTVRRGMVGGEKKWKAPNVGKCRTTRYVQKQRGGATRNH